MPTRPSSASVGPDGPRPPWKTPRVQKLNLPQRIVIVVAIGVVLWAVGSWVADNWWGGGYGVERITEIGPSNPVYHGAYVPLTPSNSGAIALWGHRCPG